jgi:hypothetical protein
MLEVAVLMLIVTESQAFSRIRSAMHLDYESIQQAPLFANEKDEAERGAAATPNRPAKDCLSWRRSTELDEDTT